MESWGNLYKSVRVLDVFRGRMNKNGSVNCSRVITSEWKQHRSTY